MPTLTLTPAEVLEQLAILKKVAWLQDFVLTSAQQAQYNALLRLRRARVRQLLVR
jgi:hypothetical protein